MLLAYRKFGLPIYHHYHEEKRQWQLADLMLPKVYIGCHARQSLRGLIRIPRHTIVNDLTLPQEQLFARLHTQTRRGIRRARREQLFAPETGTALDEFLPFARTFARQRKLSLFELEQVSELPDTDYRIYSMRLGGKLIISHLFFVSVDAQVRRATLYVSAVDQQFKHGHPLLQRKMGDANRLLHWQSMCDFKALGVELYDWGGFANGMSADKQLQGIDRFKASFGGEARPVSNYHSPLYHLIKTVRQRLSRP